MRSVVFLILTGRPGMMIKELVVGIGPSFNRILVKSPTVISMASNEHSGAKPANRSSCVPESPVAKRMGANQADFRGWPMPNSARGRQQG